MTKHPKININSFRYELLKMAMRIYQTTHTILITKSSNKIQQNKTKQKLQMHEYVHASSYYQNTNIKIP